MVDNMITPYSGKVNQIRSLRFDKQYEHKPRGCIKITAFVGENILICERNSLLKVLMCDLP